MDQPKEGKIQLQLFLDSPMAGDPKCLCSYCGTMIPEKDSPIRFWSQSEECYEGRFHESCFKALYESKSIYFGNGPGGFSPNVELVKQMRVISQKQWEKQDPEMPKWLSIDEHGEAIYDIPLLMKDIGVEDSPETREMVSQMAAGILRDMFPQISTRIQRNKP